MVIQPSENLADVRAEYSFIKEGSPLGFCRARYTARADLCFIASADMTCIDCHDPHMTHSQKREAATRQVHCLKCHEPQSCDADFDHRQALNGDDCVACHMPRIDSVLTHVGSH